MREACRELLISDPIAEQMCVQRHAVQLLQRSAEGNRIIALDL